jgi:hypothetical protein
MRQTLGEYGGRTWGESPTFCRFLRLGACMPEFDFDFSSERRS